LKKSILYLFFGITTAFCFGQKERLENRMMECIYQSFTDNGKAFKTQLSEYQKLMIEDGVLADSSGKSYRNIFKTIVELGELKKTPSKSFLEVFNDIEKPDRDKRSQCQEAISQDSSKYDFSKVIQLRQAMYTMQDSKNLELSETMSNMLTVLSDEDFELDFYKMSTFIMLEIMNTNIDSGITRKLPETIEHNYTEEHLKNAIKIHLTTKGETLIDGKIVDVKKIKSIIIDYMVTHKSESIISLNFDRETSYSSYIALQNEIVAAINQVRDQLAQKTHKTSFDKLTKAQAQEIRIVYPRNLIEGNN
jgi:hypothetical protein